MRRLQEIGVLGRVALGDEPQPPAHAPPLPPVGENAPPVLMLGVVTAIVLLSVCLYVRRG